MKAYLAVCSPGGQEYTRYNFSSMIEASPPKSSIIIGRRDEDGIFDRDTDIKLPSEVMFISRRHLLIELKETGYFWVKDLDSTNPAELRKAISSNGNNIITVKGETPHRLENGDQLLLKNKSSTEDKSEWVLHFYDPDQTDNSSDISPSHSKYEYHLSSKTLYLLTAGSQPQWIQFTGQKLKIVDYIAQKVKEEGDRYVVPHKELMAVICTEEKLDELILNSLRSSVFGIHQEISKQWGDEAPKLLDSVRGYGYRLNNCIVK
ncbi:MAG: FHA domain-containing protein [Symploca sp. SIO1A3]|nr:FHA domain-containing protein [Symploca sp. SIO1A3]